MLHQLHNIISLQWLTVPPTFSACRGTMTSNSLKPGTYILSHCSGEKPKWKTYIHLVGHFSFFSSIQGIGVAAVGGIDIVLFALGIFFILKVIRQLVRVVGHSVYELITRTFICLMCNFFNRGASQNLKFILFLLFLYIVSIKMILHLTFLTLAFSLHCLLSSFFFFTVWTKYSTYVTIVGASQGQ